MKVAVSSKAPAKSGTELNTKGRAKVPPAASNEGRDGNLTQSVSADPGATSLWRGKL